uniref:Uncharacterized protein n=1 Tax=Tetranychus urticae TaxID=32264 RepID=T1K6Q2_TETUR
MQYECIRYETIIQTNYESTNKTIQTFNFVPIDGVHSKQLWSVEIKIFAIAQLDSLNVEILIGKEMNLLCCLL